MCTILISNEVDRLEQLFRALVVKEREEEEAGGASDHPRVLEEVSVDGVVKHILQISASDDRKSAFGVFVYAFMWLGMLPFLFGAGKKILVMTGAGISTCTCMCQQLREKEHYTMLSDL